MSITITINVSDKQLLGVADYLLDDICSDFSKDQMAFAGLNRKEFTEHLITYPKFLKMVEENVKEYGPDFVEEPWDYGSCYLREMDALYNHVQTFANIMEDAERDETTQVELAEAITKLKRAGFNVWK